MDSAEGSQAQEPVETMIPHRGRMLLVERRLEVGEASARVETTVRADWPLVDARGAPPVVLVEVLAQACGLLMAYRKRHEFMGGRGFLVGLRQASFAPGRLPVGTRLELRVEVLTEVDNYVVFHGRAAAGERTWAEVELQTFRPDEMEAYRPQDEERTP